MKAAVINERGALPVIQDFTEPAPQEGSVLISVATGMSSTGDLCQMGGRSHFA